MWTRPVQATCVLAALGLVLVLATAAVAQSPYRPYEPLNPAKAQSLPTSPLTIQSGGATYAFTVELANTERQRDIGLMHRNQLAPDRGMLFDLKSEQQARFWMRNTFIPLDMIFVRANGEIVAIVENTVPHSEAPTGPNQRVLAVLELAGGTSARLGIKPGDVVHHKIFRNPP